MAWFRAMGADSVAYHQETVLGRRDDHPRQALDYYGSRGETPLRWGDTQAAHDLGLTGEVTPDAYEAAFGPGGFRHPHTGERLARTKRPGFELVVAAHKSTATLGVIGQADDMHSILDAETGGTMGWLNRYFAARGGRRGEAARPTPTTGLVYARTRHGTSRAGDPGPHDHVLVANICEMLDDVGGNKALFSALLRDTTEAATMVGRLHSAAEAIRLGYAIEPDHGPSGRLRHWRIKGIPAEVCELFSKRKDEIADYLDHTGYSGYRAKGIAARASRPIKRGTGVDELLPRWIVELEEAGWTVDRLTQALDTARQQATGLAPRLTGQEIDALAAELFDIDGEFLARWKVFGRSRLVAEIAPRLFGHDPAELDHVVDRILASPQVVPLIGLAGAREQAHTTAEILATEHAIAERIDTFATRPYPVVAAQLVDEAAGAKEAEIGGTLSQGQRDTITAICRSGRSVEVIVGVAGSGKTTALDAAATALETAGYKVVGTATSGQAARTLGAEAGIEARTMRSLLWRLDHRQLTLDPRTVVVLDEAAMTADADLARLLATVEEAGAKVVLVGDPRQLSPVGPGGAVQTVIRQHREIVTTLVENKRQHDPAERAALAELRHGDPDTALAYYINQDRIQVADSTVEALGAMVDAWAADTTSGHDTIMVTWRRSHVAALNRLARARADQQGWLTGAELQAPGGKTYAIGDPVVSLTPNPAKGLVTSQRATVTGIDHQAQALTVVTDDDRTVVLSGEEIDAKRLDHGYAFTVHRQQGGTCDRTHLFADGGGRELAYVALSRARDRSTIHAAAPNIEEAVEDIGYDWRQSHAQSWLTPITEPGYDDRLQPMAPVVETRQVKRARLRAELAVLENMAPPDVTGELAAARTQAARLAADRTDLEAGTGRWATTPQGRIARHLTDATAQLQQAEAQANAASGPLERRRARRTVEDEQRAVAAVQQEWDRFFAPAHQRLTTRLDQAEGRVAELEHEDRFNERWWAEHPDHASRINLLNVQLDMLDVHDTLDAANPAGPEGSDRSQEADPSRRPEPPDVAQLRSYLDHAPRGPSVDGGLGL